MKSHLKVHSTDDKDKNKGENVVYTIERLLVFHDHAFTGLHDPDAPIELNFEDVLYYFCPYEDCGSLFTSQIGAKQHIQKVHDTLKKSRLKLTMAPSTADGKSGL